MKSRQNSEISRLPASFENPVLVLAFIVIAALSLAFGRPVLNAYDEGLILYGASRVVSGDLPYRDFWSLYGPGSFYVLAGLDYLLGESVLTGRVFDAVVRATVVLLVYVLVARNRGRPVAIACALACFMLLAFQVREYLFPALPATAAALLALCLADRASRREGTSRPWMFPGAAVGATFLFRPDFGVYAAGACLWLAFAPLAGRKRILPPLWAFLGGVIIVAGPLYGWLIVTVPEARVFEDLLRIPMQVYVANRSMPFPDPVAAARTLLVEHKIGPVVSLWIFLPWLIAVAAIAISTTRRRSASAILSTNAPSQLLFESTCVLLIFLVLKSSVRVDSVQMLPAMVVSIVVAGLASLPDSARAQAQARLPAIAVALALLILIGGLAKARTLALLAEPAPAFVFQVLDCDAPASSRLGCFLLDPDRSAVLDYLVQNARAGDRLYVGTGRHDKLFVNNVELYFLSGMPAATRWADLHPGVQTTAAVQRKMIAEFNTRPPAWVVRNTEWDQVEEPNASRHSSDVFLLDDYLRTHYRTVLQAGSLSVSVPRSAATP